MIRLILQCRRNSEIVIFSEDLQGGGEKFIYPGYTLAYDEKLDIELPVGFPLDAGLLRIKDDL